MAADTTVLAGPPKLRDDLITSRQETPEGATYVVKDPATRRFFRFREAEHVIALQLDGSTPLESVRERVQRELDTPVPAESLQQFVNQLGRLGLLQTDRPSSAEPRPFRQRIAGSPLYITLRAFDPDRLFDRLIGKLAFFFTPGFLVASVAIFVVACAITLNSWDEIIRDMSRLYRFDALLLAWVTVLLVTTGHEFAHGLTCKRFGGEVHEIGFMLLYFQPAFYCNISDAWLFPEKSRRLWVTFAGAYFEIFVWSLATVTWSITEPDTWVSFIAMIVMATSAIKTVFNLNPLIKLDGYYLLSDWLEIPNLRGRSMEYLKARVKRLFGGSAVGTTAPRRERRIYLVYGVLAAAYSYWLLSTIALHFGSYLVTQYQGPGFIAFSGLLMIAFNNPLGRAAGSLRASFRRPPSDNPRPRRPHARVAFLVAVPAVLLLGQLELKVSGEFTVLPVRNADVRAVVDGTIAHINVEEGDRVAAGDVLLRLADRDYLSDLHKIEAEIVEKRATLKMLRAGPREEEVRLARHEVEAGRTRHEHARKRVEEADKIRATRLSKAEVTVKAAVERLQYARTDRQRARDLFETGLISRKQFDDAEQEVGLREQELEVARAELQTVSADSLADVRQALAIAEGQIQEAGGKLQLLLAGARPEAIEAMEAEIARLETHRTYLAEQVRLTTIESPAAGVVTTPKLKQKIGEHVKKGDLILKIFELETVTPEVQISEKEIAEVQIGQRVVLKARAYPGRSFTGSVKAIAPAAVEESALRRKVFRVTIAMDQPSDLLKPEMTGNAKIYCGTRSIGDLLTRRIARYLRVEFWSWW